MVFGVVMTLPGVAAAGTVMINTDSTVEGAAATSAPPLPQAASRAPSPKQAPPLPQAASRSPSPAQETTLGGRTPSRQVAQNDLQWERVDEPRTPPRVESSPSASSPQTRSISTRDESHRISSPKPLASVEAEGNKPSRKASTPSARLWKLEPGLLKDQLIAWGRQDTLWDVLWEGSSDVEIEVSHNFYGDLDESVIDVITALAKSGVPIRLMRAKANHKLIVRSGK